MQEQPKKGADKTLRAEFDRALEREAATREILEAISNSRADEAPVFDAVLKNAARLCDAPIARLELANEARTHFRIAAAWGQDLKSLSIGDVIPLDLPLMVPRTIKEARSFHCHDLADTPEYREREPYRVLMVEEEGIRTYLTIPLISEGVGIGCIVLSRQEVKAFDEDDIEIVKTFADQAVIAIENSRQYRELQVRLDREAATREILSVISQSRDDERPVFDAILKSAARLCNSPIAWLMLTDEKRTKFILTAAYGDELQAMRLGEEFDLESSYRIAITIREARTIEIPDLKQTDEYRAGEQVYVKLVEEELLRTRINVPLIRNGVAIGCLVLSRREVRSFSSDEVALVETFAEQAVIAIENVRQFKALESLNSELGDRVEEQVGEIERMGRLKRFLPAAVADTVVSRGSEKLLESHRSLLGVLFCDIRGFTAFCETAEPEETIEVLQNYHQEMGKLISEHGAGVDHRMGDGIMVLFNDPLPCEDPAGDAVRLAISMRSRMAELSNKWKRLGYRLGFGVGVSLGYATVGLVGYEGRSDYTASGTAVNLAARLCDRAEDGEILLSPRAFTAIEDNFAAEPTGEINLKGIREPVAVYRLADEIS
ncbi:MAG: GAF domain-containing protein [Ruegeria sp.]